MAFTVNPSFGLKCGSDGKSCLGIKALNLSLSYTCAAATVNMRVSLKARTVNPSIGIKCGRDGDYVLG